MFPFASGPSDLDLALRLVEDAKAELRREGEVFGEDLPVGLTIEVPSAALTTDLLAREVEFISIGTNDLIQYLLAVDRADPRVSALYQPLHPAVVRTIHHVLRAAGSTCRSRYAERWPPILCRPCSWSASGCATSRWLPPRSPGSRPPFARSRCPGHGRGGSLPRAAERGR